MKITIQLNQIFRILAVVLCLLLGQGTCVFAQAQTDPDVMIRPSDPHVPMVLKGLTIDPAQPLGLRFVIDTGDRAMDTPQVHAEARRLIHYFMASLAIPTQDLWVNLSPNEPDRIIPTALGQTELGRDLLEQDYILKQLSSALLYPENPLGAAFWDELHQTIVERHGGVDIPVDTFNKVWILPASAAVLEQSDGVVILEARLKVMLDADYQSMNGPGHQGQAVTADQTRLDIYRELIVPAIEHEVNHGKNFAPLRQIYHSLILAKWYKETLAVSVLGQLYADQQDVRGIDTVSGEIKTDIYERYLTAYRRGAFDYIREDYDRLSGSTIPRRYFSGGFTDVDLNLERRDRAMISDAITGDTFELDIEVVPRDAEGRAISVNALLGDVMNDFTMLSEDLNAILEDSSLGDDRFYYFARLKLERAIEDAEDIYFDDKNRDNWKRLEGLFDQRQRLLDAYEQGVIERVKAEEVFRVVQWNLLKNPTAERMEVMREQFVSTLGPNRPQVITMQETTDLMDSYNLVREMARSIGYQWHEFLYKGEPLNREGLAIAYHSSLEVVETVERNIIDGKVLLGIKFRSTLTQREYYVFTTHLSFMPNEDDIRINQIRNIHKIIEEVVPEGTPVILSGDLNFFHPHEFDQAGAILNGFVDSFNAVNPGVKGHTFSRRNPLVEYAAKRLDVIYARGFNPVESNILLDQAPFASDHFALRSDLELRADRAEQGLSVRIGREVLDGLQSVGIDLGETFWSTYDQAMTSDTDDTVGGIDMQDISLQRQNTDAKIQLSHPEISPYLLQEITHFTPELIQLRKIEP